MSEFFHILSNAMAMSRSVEDLRGVLHQALSSFGLEKFTYQIVNHSALHNLSNYYVTTFAPEWEKRYLDQNYFDSDPLVNKYMTNGSSFVWHEEKELSLENKKSAQMFSEASSFNLHQGVGIPMPGPNNSFSILTLCSDGSTLREIQDVHQNFNRDLMLCGWMFHASLLSLNLDGAMFQTYDLTNKEIECLKWICAGKSNGDIASILGISEHTIKARVSAILKKMNCVSRMEVVMKTRKYKVVDC